MNRGSGPRFFFPMRSTTRVEIRVTNLAKHRLPVTRNCAWFHPNGLSKAGDACKLADGKALEGYTDLWRCMEEAACHIEGEVVKGVLPS